MLIDFAETLGGLRPRPGRTPSGKCSLSRPARSCGTATWPPALERRPALARPVAGALGAGLPGSRCIRAPRRTAGLHRSRHGRGDRDSGRRRRLHPIPRGNAGGPSWNKASASHPGTQRGPGAGVGGSDLSETASNRLQRGRGARRPGRGAALASARLGTTGSGAGPGARSVFAVRDRRGQDDPCSSHPPAARPCGGTEDRFEKLVDLLQRDGVDCGDAKATAERFDPAQINKMLE